MNTIQEKELLRDELIASKIPFIDKIVNNDSAIDQLYKEAVNVEKVPNFDLFMSQFGNPEFIQGEGMTERYQKLRREKRDYFYDNYDSVGMQFLFYDINKIPTIQKIKGVDGYVKNYILNPGKVGDEFNDKTDHNKYILSLINEISLPLRELIKESISDYRTDVQAEILLNEIKIENKLSEKDISLIDSKINSLILFVQKNKNTEKQELKFSYLFNSEYRDKINEFVSYLETKEIIKNNKLNSELCKVKDFVRYYYLLKENQIINDEYKNTIGVTTYLKNFNIEVSEKADNKNKDVVTRRNVTDEYAKDFDKLDESEKTKIIKIFIPNYSD